MLCWSDQKDIYVSDSSKRIQDILHIIHERDAIKV